jgi:dihydroflavonol-4-reductase
MAMKTLVTGATGFIGSAVVRRLLDRGREVRCYVEPAADRRALAELDVEIVEGDVLDAPKVGLALKGCDKLYHLAAIYKLWLPDRRRMYDVNVEGSQVVLLAARKAELQRIVYTSSIAAVGHRPGKQLSDEGAEFNSWDEANDYIRSKWLSERLALCFAREGLPVVVVNPAFPFGERDIGPTPTGGLILEALRGKVPGYLEGGFNAVDVDDVAEGHVLAEEKGKVGERYILGAHNVTHRQFYEAVTRAAGIRAIQRKLPVRMLLGMAWAMERYAASTGKPPMVTRKAIRYASHHVWFDCSRARQELGMPETPLEETVDKAIRWFRDNGYDRQ